MAHPMIYIILLNYNGYTDTIECVKSIEKITYNNYKIVIVDNNSTDKSEEILREEFEKKHIILQTGDNLGFAGGNNVGIKYAIQNGANYILLLNNDTVVEKNFLMHLMNAFNSEKYVGMVGGKINYYDDRNEVWYAGGKFNKIRAKGKHFINDTNEKYKKVDFITGCLQLISVESLKEVGFMEEKYFLYYEDVDYCFRFRQKGYKLIYCKDALIYHKCGGSAGYKTPLSIFYSNRNRYIFISRYFNGIECIFMKLVYYIELVMKFILYRKDRRKSIINVIMYIIKNKS